MVVIADLFDLQVTRKSRPSKTGIFILIERNNMPTDGLDRLMTTWDISEKFTASKFGASGIAKFY